MPTLTLCPALEYQRGIYIDRMSTNFIVVGLFTWLLIIEL